MQKLKIQNNSSRDTPVRIIEHGQPDGRPPFILLHGISMPPTHWSELPKALGRYTVAVGIPNSSETPKLPSMNWYAERVGQAITEVAGDSYDVLGLSWGGLLAQQLAKVRRPQVRKLVLAATAPLTPAVFWARPNPSAIKIVNSTVRSPDAAALLYGGDISRNPDLVKKLGIEREVDPKQHHQQQYAAIRLLMGASTVSNVLRPHPDTLVMAGNDDPLIPFWSARAGASLTNAQFERVEGGGHGFLLTRPEESAKTINNFLDS